MNVFKRELTAAQLIFPYDVLRKCFIYDEIARKRSSGYLSKVFLRYSFCRAVNRQYCALKRRAAFFKLRVDHLEPGTPSSYFTVKVILLTFCK